MSSTLDLQYLGLTTIEINTLRNAIREHHPKGGMQTATTCVCGSGSGGKAGQQLCRILQKLMDAGAEVRMGRTPRRDPAICDHTVDGKLQIYEYPVGTIRCELCSSEVKS